MRSPGFARAIVAEIDSPRAADTSSVFCASADAMAVNAAQTTAAKALPRIGCCDGVCRPHRRMKNAIATLGRIGNADQRAWMTCIDHPFFTDVAGGHARDVLVHAVDGIERQRLSGFGYHLRPEARVADE